MVKASHLSSTFGYSLRRNSGLNLAFTKLTISPSEKFFEILNTSKD